MMENLPSKCPSCEKAFVCDLLAGKKKCWCQDFEPLISPKKDAACLCPGCLQQALQKLKVENLRDRQESSKGKDQTPPE